MAKTKGGREYARVHLHAHPDTMKQMEMVRRAIHADTLSEAVRRAVNLYAVVLRQREQGTKVIVRGPEGDWELVVI